MTLLGFNSDERRRHHGCRFSSPSLAEATVDEALRRVRLADTIQPEALVTVHAVDDTDRLHGTVTVVGLLHSDSATPRLMSTLIDNNPVRVTPGTDVVDVTILMSDYNLMTVPVVSPENQLLGVITVDDVLEVTIPDDWRRREPPPHPEQPLTEHDCRGRGPFPPSPRGNPCRIA